MKPLYDAMDHVDAFMARTVGHEGPWWAWPLALVTLAVGSLTAAVLVSPGAGESTWLLGSPFGGECGSKVLLGIPCPQCGMTRSWVHAVRGDLLRAVTYNPAGVLLLLWIVVAGVIGGVRLMRRDPEALKPPYWLLFAWVVFWLAVPYSGMWIARLFGINPLPEFL